MLRGAFSSQQIPLLDAQMQSQGFGAASVSVSTALQLQKSLGALPPDKLGRIFALAEGLGAHNTGIIASRTAIRQVRERFRDASAKEPLRSMLERLAHEVNGDVYDMAHRVGHGGASMATTLLNVACDSAR